MVVKYNTSTVQESVHSGKCGLLLYRIQMSVFDFTRNISMLLAGLVSSLV
jgi:hypothetical protein